MTEIARHRDSALPRLEDPLGGRGARAPAPGPEVPHFRTLVDHDPYPWQRRLYARLVAGAVPEAVDVPTGCGKTACVLLALLARLENRSLPRRVVHIVDPSVQQAEEPGVGKRQLVGPFEAEFDAVRGRVTAGVFAGVDFNPEVLGRPGVDAKVDLHYVAVVATGFASFELHDGAFDGAAMADVLMPHALNHIGRGLTDRDSLEVDGTVSRVVDPDPPVRVERIFVRCEEADARQLPAGGPVIGKAGDGERDQRDDGLEHGLREACREIDCTFTVSFWLTRKTTLSTCFYGGPSGIRTPDPLIKSQLLCQLS